MITNIKLETIPSDTVTPLRMSIRQIMKVLVRVQENWSPHTLVVGK